MAKKSKIELLVNDYEWLEGVQKRVDIILSSLEVDERLDDWLAVELDRISASIEQIKQDYCFPNVGWDFE